MSAGVNLHDVVRGAITYLNPDEEVTLVRSIGLTNTFGRVVPKWADPVIVKAQVQSANESPLEHVNLSSQNKQIVRFFFYASPETRPAGIDRPYARTGDMIFRRNQWYLITSEPHDFSPIGWVCVNATLQETPPEGVTVNG